MGDATSDAMGDETGNATCDATGDAMPAATPVFCCCYFSQYYAFLRCLKYLPPLPKKTKKNIDATLGRVI